MKIVIFELSMPNIGSWNGKWTGSSQKRTIKKKLLKDEEFLIGKSFYYDFGDGWGANIKVRLAENREKPTNMFYGYEWMIRSILKYGKIIRDEQ